MCDDFSLGMAGQLIPVWEERRKELGLAGLLGIRTEIFAMACYSMLNLRAETLHIVGHNILQLFRQPELRVKPG